MKLSTREDIDAPIETVFETLVNFDYFERAAMRRGADVRRVQAGDATGVGTQWDVRFAMRGKHRDLKLEVIRREPPTDLVIAVTSDNIVGEVKCELFALTRNLTRMTVATEVRPLNLPARLLIQSLKLTKTRLSEKYADRVRGFVADIATQKGRGA